MFDNYIHTCLCVKHIWVSLYFIEPFFHRDHGAAFNKKQLWVERVEADRIQVAGACFRVHTEYTNMAGRRIAELQNNYGVLFYYILPEN